MKVAMEYFSVLVRIGILSWAISVVALAQPQKILSARDFKSIYKLTLTDFLEQEKKILPQCGYPLLGKKKVIYLFSENIKKAALPTLTKFAFHLLDKSEIVKKANDEDGFCFVSIVFSKIEPEKVTLAISEKLEHKTYQQAGHGSRYECQKDNARWICKAIAVVMESR